MPGLTLRGRAFVAAGATVVLCSFLLGQSALLRIGVLLACLPLLAWLLLGWRRQSATVTRSLPDAVVAAGSSAEVALDITARGASALTTLLAEEVLPYALGARPRFVIDRPGRGSTHHFTYSVRPDQRGVFALGPLTTRATDPFGLVEVRRTSAGAGTLTVTPRVVDLPPIDIGRGRTGNGDRRLPHAAAGSPDDVMVRDYRRGDDLRRVHWPSSARTGGLMVRREEQPWEARATVLLDDRASAHRGVGAAGSLELAVVVAASVAAHLDAHGFTVRLAWSDGLCSAGAEPLSTILERLAVVSLSDRPDLDAAWASEGGVVVGVLGGLLDTDGPALTRVRRAAGSALAMTLDVEQWAGTAAAGSTAATLRSLGWRAATIGRGDPLDHAWRSLSVGGFGR
ncbi:DUF58 domain-containing protein [Nocardioides montaniterrae]